MLKNFFMIAALLVATYVVNAQKTQFIDCGKDIPESQVAFTGGERLRYAVSYKASIINTDVADITFTTTEDKYAGHNCYKIHAYGKTRSFYSLFFTLEDTYITWVDRSTLRPIKATSNLHEGGYRYRSSMDFVWSKGKVYAEGINLKHQTSKRRTMNLVGCSYDALSLFFNVRSADLRNIHRGESQSLSLVLDDTIRTIRFRFLGREKRKVSGLGEFATLKFACQFATSSDESFKDGAEFYLWLSDDRNHIPIYLESPIRVGKVYATIKEWSGLKHPFSSIVITN